MRSVFKIAFYHKTLYKASYISRVTAAVENFLCYSYLLKIILARVCVVFMAGKLAVQTPIGKALLGHTVGEVVEAKVPAGIIKFEILDITL